MIDVFVEIDVGQRRWHCAPGRGRTAGAGNPEAPALRFAGLQAYHGRAQHLRSAQERRDAIAVAVDDVVFTRKLIEAQGVPVDLVTGAGHPAPGAGGSQRCVW